MNIIQWKCDVTLFQVLRCRIPQCQTSEQSFVAGRLTLHKKKSSMMVLTTEVVEVFIASWHWWHIINCMIILSQLLWNSWLSGSECRAEFFPIAHLWPRLCYWSASGGIPYMGYKRMCGLKGYDFLPVLIINRISILAILALDRM